MNKITITLILLCCGIFLAAGTTTLALTTVLESPNETNLLGTDGILDQLYDLGKLQRVDDDGDRTWFPANGSATATAKFAGFTQNFGYIPDTNRNGFGDDSFQSLFTVPGATNGIGLGGPSAPLSSENVPFLWALNPYGSQVWTSLPSQNSDGWDHMVTWRIIDKPNTWVIAWEDLPGGGSDRDFNDLVVEVSVSEIPIPAAILLLGSGLVGLAGIRKKFKR
jgi:hypothetical protein